MTPEEYRARLKAMGLTPVKPSYDGGTLFRDREGMFITAPDPEPLSAEERSDILTLLMGTHGYSLDS
jgi:hypothetical protein